MNTFDTISSEYFTCPTMVEFNMIKNIPVFIGTLRTNGFIFDNEYDNQKYIVAYNHKILFINNKNEIPESIKHNIKITSSEMLFLYLATYVDAPVDKQFYKITDPICDDDFMLYDWADGYFYWLNSQQKCLPEESPYYNKGFRKVTPNEIIVSLSKFWDKL